MLGKIYATDEDQTIRLYCRYNALHSLNIPSSLYRSMTLVDLVREERNNEFDCRDM